VIDSGDIATAWDAADPDRPEPTVAFFGRLFEAHRDDPRAAFEYASAFDFAGREAEAAPLYERALAGGLETDLERQATIQYASTLRNLGRAGEAVEILRTASRRFPDDAAVTAFLALALSSDGDPLAAVRELLELVLDRVDDPSLRQYARPLRVYAREVSP
jgi:tetratricopeptide (TPR) repeat protein